MRGISSEPKPKNPTEPRKGTGGLPAFWGLAWVCVSSIGRMGTYVRGWGGTFLTSWDRTVLFGCQASYSQDTGPTEKNCSLAELHTDCRRSHLYVHSLYWRGPRSEGNEEDQGPSSNLACRNDRENRNWSLERICGVLLSQRIIPLSETRVDGTDACVKEHVKKSWSWGWTSKSLRTFAQRASWRLESELFRKQKVAQDCRHL